VVTSYVVVVLDSGVNFCAEPNGNVLKFHTSGLSQRQNSFPGISCVSTSAKTVPI